MPLSRFSPLMSLAYAALLVCFGVIGFPYLSASCSAAIIPADRLADWDSAGVPGGIPHNSTICATINASQYGDGETDATAAFQAAIDNCPADQVVFVPAGRYRLNGQVNISKSRVTLRGAGPDETIILSNSGRGFMVGGGAVENNYIDVVAGAQKGSNQITLADASSINVGNYLIIDEENADPAITAEGHEGFCNWCGEGRCTLDHNTHCPSWDHGKVSNCSGKGMCESGQRTVGFIVKVTGKNGNTLTLEHDLFWNFTNDPQVLKFTLFREKIGIEDLYVTKISQDGSHTVELGYCDSCWLKNVEFYNADQRHIWTYNTYHNEFRDSYFHHAKCYAGNYGYGFSLQGHVTAALIENNIFDFLHCPVSFSSSGAGNVTAYNFFKNGRFDYPSCGSTSYQKPQEITHHGAHPVFNLYEGNVVNGLGADFIWGTTSHTTFVRNRAFGFQEDSRMSIHPVSLAKGVRYQTFVGNVLGTEGVDFEYEMEGTDEDYCWYLPYIYHLCYKDGDTCRASECDPVVKQTLLRHGNYDYANNGVVWDPAIADHDVPDSFYLSGKPSWWGNIPWPAYGPGRDNDNKIPAQVRYEAMGATCGNGKPDQTEVRRVIDENEAQLTGNWQRVTGKPYSYLNDYVEDGTAGSDQNTYVTFPLNITVSGHYDVNFQYQPVWNGAKQTPVSITHRDGTFNGTVDESNWSQGTAGVSLGRFYFRSGDDNKLVVSANSSGVTSADSVRLFLHTEEECDDGNTINGDGCSAVCTIESGGGDTNAPQAPANLAVR